MRGDGTATHSGRRWLVPASLAVVAVSFLVFAFGLAARIENPLWNAPAFSGWCAAVGHQLVAGKRLYRDVTLPIPPGSFALLAWLERAAGHGPRLLYENRLCEVCYALMGLAAYAMARPLAGRRVALFAAGAAMGWACIWAKQLAYDALAEATAWAALALLVQAWSREPGAVERRWLFAAGLTVGGTLLFKQSTAVGVLAGGLLGLGYLALVERREAGALGDRLRGVLAFCAGSLAGAALCVLAFGMSGGAMGGFLRAAFVDGAALKGRRTHIASRIAVGFLAQPVALWSTAAAIVFAALVFRVARRTGLSTSDPDDRAPGTRDAVGVAAAAVLVFGAGALTLTGWLHPSPVVLVVNYLSPHMIAMGFGMVIVFFFGNLAAPAGERAARAFNAAALAALATCFTVSTSMTYFNPFYENNPLMAVVVIGLLLAFVRTKIPGLPWLGFVILMAQPLAWRVPFARSANRPAPSGSFFDGMKLDGAGQQVVRIADRIRAVAPPRGTVLSFPEDPGLETLVGRPRPPLCGAIVFSDQYPERCVAHDRAELERHPPDVIVLRPANRRTMLGVLRYWNPHPPAEQLFLPFLERHLGEYRRVGSYRTRWVHGNVVLQIWRRREPR